MGKRWILRFYLQGNLLENYHTCPLQITNIFIFTHNKCLRFVIKNAKLYYNLRKENGGLRLCQFDFISTIITVQQLSINPFLPIKYCASLRNIILFERNFIGLKICKNSFEDNVLVPWLFKYEPYLSFNW